MSSIRDGQILQGPQEMIPLEQVRKLVGQAERRGRAQAYHEIASDLRDKATTEVQVVRGQLYGQIADRLDGVRP